jgi:hypothetical protein
MKAIKLLLVTFFLLFASTVQADGHIGPAFRLNGDGSCGWYVYDSFYEGSWFVQFSNGNTGHATFKCKMKLQWGDGEYYYGEGESGGWPLDALGYPGAICYETLSAEGGAAMWTAQCFGAWEPGE